MKGAIAGPFDRCHFWLGVCPGTGIGPPGQLHSEGDEYCTEQQKDDDAAAHEAKLTDVPRWPVTISYFSKDKAGDGGEQTPDYAIGFELYDNGISRALTLDYNDFIISGRLVSLDIKTPKLCK